VLNITESIWIHDTFVQDGEFFDKISFFLMMLIA